MKLVPRNITRFILKYYIYVDNYMTCYMVFESEIVGQN